MPPDFFGREALTERLIARLTESGEMARFLAVIGPSGSGKSSIVRAGLVPALRRGMLPNSERWHIVDMFPGAYPLEELEAALLRIAINPPTSLLNQLQEDARGLSRAINRVLPGDDTELVLIIDQFEEVFTSVEDEDSRAHFLDSLHLATSDLRSRVRVIWPCVPTSWIVHCVMQGLENWFARGTNSSCRSRPTTFNARLSAQRNGRV